MEKGGDKGDGRRDGSKGGGGKLGKSNSQRDAPRDQGLEGRKSVTRIPIFPDEKEE